MESAWTDERTQYMKQLFLDGMPAGAIAKELGGVTRNAVIGKLHRIGVNKRMRLNYVPPARPRRPRRKRSARPYNLARLKVAPEEERAPLGGVSIFAVRDDQCRFPLTVNYAPLDLKTFRYCGRRITEGSVLKFCAEHKKICVGG